MADSDKASTTEYQPRSSRGLLRAVLDHLLEGCQVISPDYRYLYVNQAVARQGRTTRESLLGRTMMECYPGIEDTEMFSVLRRCLTDGTAEQMENEFMFPDGSIGWFELRFEPIPDGAVILSVDITDRKRAELALCRAMRALTTLSRCNHSLVRAVDESQFVQDVCHLVVDPGGYPMAWIGLRESGNGKRIKPVAWAAHEEGNGHVIDTMQLDSPWSTALVERALRTDQPVVARFAETDSASGSRQEDALEHGFSACIALPIRDGGTIKGALTIYAAEQYAFDDDEQVLLREVAMDLAYGIETLRARRARLEAVQELEAAHARTRAIYDHLPHATFVWRYREACFTLLDCNDAARTATDAGVVALLGRPAREIESGLPHLDEDLSHCMDGHEAVSREVDCVLPGARQPRRMALTYGFIPPDMVLLHAQDVTEQRRTEEQLVASQRLEAVGRLAGGVAHDFNNLLSVILTNAELAAEQLPTPDPVRADIEQVIEAGQRAAALTRRLLAFSRKQALQPRIVRPNQVIVGLEHMLRRLLREDIDIEMHAASDLGNVMVDPGQLEQVIINLAVNARDAMPEGGKLTIETANVDLDEEYADQHLSVGAGRYIRISVADTGVGMSTKTQHRIFEPFFTTKEGGKGTGLGLSIVYGIVKQSGGNIWVYSEPGRGTTFKVYLPRVDASPLEPEPIQRDVMPGGNETVVVVEDEPAVGKAAERILRGAGYQVLTASSGREALLRLEEHPGQVDLLLTDVVMPEMSGRELAERLRELNPELKVLFTSGYTDAAVLHHGVLDPNVRFIGKPFSVGDLTRRVREVLDEPVGG